MQISIQSWHYRLAEYAFDKYPPANLCPYFWAVITAVPWIVISKVFSAFFNLGEDVSYFVFNNVLRKMPKTYRLQQVLLPIIMILGTLLGVMAITFPQLVIADSFSTYLATFLAPALYLAVCAGCGTSYSDYDGILGIHAKNTAPKPDSLFKAWLKAKHDKVCPMIDFVD